MPVSVYQEDPVVGQAGGVVRMALPARVLALAAGRVAGINHEFRFLPAGLRLRITGSGRLERHDDSSQDASSVYVALDLRRSF